MRHRYTGAFPRLATLVGVLMCTVLVFSRMAIGETVSNIVLLIGDGMGFEQIRAGACFKGANLCFEAWPNRGEVRTHSANAAITDSAASGTAMATGHKADNGVISLAIPGDGREYETALEYLKRKGSRRQDENGVNVAA